MATINLRVVDLYEGDRVSSFKQAVDFGIWGIIHKASHGANRIDSEYANRRAAAVKAGMLWGAYHFGTNEDVITQVKNFLSAAKPDESTLVALDYEESKRHPERTMHLGDAREFMKRIARELGRKPVIYSGHNLKEDLGDTVDKFFGSHRLWLADYRKKWNIQKSWTKYWLRQYTDSKNKNPPNQVPGLPGDDKGNLDCNTYDGSMEQLESEWAS